MIFGDWRLVLAMTPLLLILILCRAIKQYVAFKSWHSHKKKTEDGSKIFYEALSSIRTVKQFNLGKRIVDNYRNGAAATLAKTRKNHVIQGVLMTLSEIGLWCTFALTTLLCAVIVRYADGSPVRMVFTIGSFLSLLNLSDAATRDFADTATSLAALRKLQRIEACQSSIEDPLRVLTAAEVAEQQGGSSTSTSTSTSSSGGASTTTTAVALTAVESMMPVAECAFAVEFANVSFAYHTRLDRFVLNDVSFEVPAGSSAAFVGPSGCGKSTLYAMILRWYDAASGEVKLDGEGVKDQSLSKLRARVSLVAQEPKLFTGKVWENIAFGLLPHQQPLTGFYETFAAFGAVHPKEYSAIIDAAKAANAHDFIVGANDPYVRELEADGVSEKSNYVVVELEKDGDDEVVAEGGAVGGGERGGVESSGSNSLGGGYDTQVGRGGGQVSGGQKQRIAIAYVLVFRRVFTQFFFFFFFFSYKLYSVPYSYGSSFQTSIGERSRDPPPRRGDLCA